MRGAIPPLPQYPFMAWCLVKHRDSFTYTFTFTLFRAELYFWFQIFDVLIKVCHINLNKAPEVSLERNARAFSKLVVLN
jgi:hypothetical protein